MIKYKVHIVFSNDTVYSNLIVYRGGSSMAMSERIRIFR